MAVTWKDLPEPVQEFVQQHVGAVTDTVEMTSGRNSDVAAVLYAERGRRVFLKGVNGVSRRMRWLRNEITAGQYTVDVAPAVLFHADVEGWLLVGFQYVPGRAANLAPGSPDLPLVASTVEKISALRATGLRPVRDRWAVTDWWRRLAEQAPNAVEGWDTDELSRLTSLVPEMVDGDRLLHTDLHGDQFLIGYGREVRVIGWGFPAAGAAWVDVAFMVLRLVDAGHDPAAAEAWARSLSCFSSVGRETLDAFSAYLAGLWSYWAITDDAPGVRHRARLARDYTARRLPHTAHPVRSAGST